MITKECKRSKMAIDGNVYLHCEQNFIIMYSSEDFERFYFQY